MKKFLLMTVAVSFAAVVSAQQYQVLQEPQQKVKMYTRSFAKAPESISLAKKAPRKSAANGVLYNRPEGSFYHAFSKEGRGYYQTFLIVPPYTDVNFQNVSTASGAATWTYNGQDITDSANGDVLEFGFAGIQDPLADGLRYFSMPTLSIGGTEFTLGTEGKYSSYASYGSGFAVDTLTSLSFADQHNSGYGFGSLDSHFLYGTGKISYSQGDYAGQTATCIGVEQDFEKPMSPLYIEDAYLPFYSNSETPIPAGKELILRFFELDDQGQFGNVIAEMTATADDVFDVEDVTSSVSSGLGYEGKWFSGSVTFTQKSTDAFGGVSVEPVIIDKAFAVVILGVDQEGVNIGFTSTSITDGTNIDNAYFIVEREDGNYGYHYYTDESLHISFTGLFDKIVFADDDTKVYVAPNEGGAAVMKNDSETDAVLLYTAFPWYDNAGNENYYVDVEYTQGDEEWFDALAIDDSYYTQTNSNGNYYGVNLLQVKAKELPSGVTGRKATVHVYGSGVEESFQVIQGDVDSNSTGIESMDATNTVHVSTIAPVYNLNGQQVDKSYKGIVIKNGKKIVQK